VAWLLAGALTAAGALALGSAEGAVVAGGSGLAFALWSGRQVVGLHLARRDFLRADTPPRRAYVLLLHDPNPRAFRPLLAVWSERPPGGTRLPKPEQVWRCDDEVDQLESFQGDPVVHEAWVDTGPRFWSKPRWVRADAGIALPHRRALLGRWYVSLVLRSARSEEARRLTLDDPHAVPDIAEELPLEGRLLRSVAGRGVLLAALVAAAVLLG
jgi:hypothetical protein